MSLDDNGALSRLRKVVSFINDVGQALSALELWWNRLQTVLDRYGMFFAALIITERDVHRTLIKYNWLITPSIPPEFLVDIVEIGNKKGNQRRKINCLFVDYYSADNFIELEKMAASWSKNSIFKPRMKIIQDCIGALKYANGRYNPSNVVLPTLIAQIDGIRTEYLIAQGFKLEGTRWKDANGDKATAMEEFSKLTKRDDALDTGRRMFVKVLFQTAFYGNPLTEYKTFNRHKILHGEHLRYGNRANVIRAFLILDFLSMLP